jgi:hypothetical protein
MRIGLLAACAVLALSAGGAFAGTFESSSCEEINGVGDCGQLVHQTNQNTGNGTVQQNSVSINVSGGGGGVTTCESTTTTDVNGKITTTTTTTCP